LQADLLIGAGCVETLDTSGVSLGEFGPAPRFSSATISGAVHVRDATCPALHAQFQAAEKARFYRMALRSCTESAATLHTCQRRELTRAFRDVVHDRVRGSSQLVTNVCVAGFDLGSTAIR
jgi:glutaconate CoA-transferase subunit A